MIVSSRPALTLPPFSDPLLHQQIEVDAPTTSSSYSSSSSSSSASKVIRVQFFPTSDRMAFVEMSDVDAAFEAIIRVHDQRLDVISASGSRPRRGKPLFVNFSKVHLKDFNKSGWHTAFRAQ